MNVIQFLLYYHQGSIKSAIRYLVTLKRVPWPCDCDWDRCQGWQMVNVYERYIGFPLFAVQESLRERIGRSSKKDL